VIIDVTAALRSSLTRDGKGRAIVTSRVLSESAGGAFAWDRVERLLLVTQAAGCARDVSLASETIALLEWRCPDLVLVGTDAPDLELPGRHAASQRHQPLAALLALDFSTVAVDRWVAGTLETVFAAASEEATSSLGCQVRFSPDVGSGECSSDPDTDSALEIHPIEPDAQLGFLEPPRDLDGSIFPPEPAWDDLRTIVLHFMRGPCEPQAYRRAVLAVESAKGEAVALATEAAIDRLSRVEVAQVYSTLMLMAQKFIYADPSDAREFIPRCIGRAWKKAGGLRGTPLTLTYDGAIINNWRVRDPTQPLTYDNIDAFLTINGSASEHSFIRIHVALEAAGGDLPRRMISLQGELEAQPEPATRVRHLNHFLQEAQQRMEAMIGVLAHMWKDVRRDVFWDEIRVTMLGSPESAFPDGIRIASTDTILTRKGGSGAQSPLMHALDRFLAVDHIDPDAPEEALSKRQRLALRTLEAPPEHARAFIDEQISFMSARHRKFHERLLEIKTLRELVLLHGDDSSAEHYNGCVWMLEKWRKVHQNMVHRYVVDKIAPKVKPCTDGEADVGGTTRFLDKARGTMTSVFMPLLAQLVSETRSARLTKEG
jgi:indoleamine 2,3-dioxygenase